MLPAGKENSGFGVNVMVLFNPLLSICNLHFHSLTSALWISRPSKRGPSPSVEVLLESG